MSKGVFMQDMLKSRCKFVTLSGKYTQQKQVGWEVVFSELGFAGSRAHKPWRELKGSALDFFLQLVLRLQGASIVQVKYYLKASVQNMTFGRGKSNHTLARCIFFTNTVLQKS